MQVMIHAADGLYEKDKCIGELLYFKLIDLPFLPREGDALIVDTFDFEVEQPVINSYLQTFEVYTESTHTEDKYCFEVSRRAYIQAGWTEE